MHGISSSPTANSTPGTAHPHQAGGELLATLDLIDYTQPQRLYAPTSKPFSVSMTGNTLTISRAPGYLGSFDVLISVADGVATAIERLHVTAAWTRTPFK